MAFVEREFLTLSLNKREHLGRAAINTVQLVFVPSIVNPHPSPSSLGCVPGDCGARRAFSIAPINNLSTEKRIAIPRLHSPGLSPPTSGESRRVSHRRWRPT